MFRPSLVVDLSLQSFDVCGVWDVTGAALVTYVRRQTSSE
jgi:hypothetical protein